MESNEKRVKLLKNIKKEISFFDKRVSNYQFYNFRNKIIINSIRFLCVVDSVMPFALSFVSLFFLAPEGHKPFVVDKVKVYANVQLVDSSNGSHLKKSSFDIDYSNMIEFLSSWTCVNENLYKRSVISYSFDDIDLGNLDDIFVMSQEKLDEKFEVISVEDFYKDKLLESDEIYFEDIINVFRVKKSDVEYRYVDEEKFNNFFDTFCYCFLSLMSSSFLIGLIDSVFKDSSFFDDMELRFKSISDEDLAIMKKILSVEKDNYALLTDDSVTKRKIRKRDD